MGVRCVPSIAAAIFMALECWPLSELAGILITISVCKNTTHKLIKVPSISRRPSKQNPHKILKNAASKRNPYPHIVAGLDPQLSMG